MLIRKSFFCTAIVFGFCGFGLAAPANAAVIFSTSQTAPTVDGLDIANLDQSTTFQDFQTSVIWGDRPARGQSFTTGNYEYGYELSAVTVQSATAQNGNGDYLIRIGTVTGGLLSNIVTEGTGTVTTDVAANDFVTLTFDSPVTLDPNTVYGFSILRDNGSGWQLLNNAAASYPDGTAFTSGFGSQALGNGFNGTISAFHNFDRIFHLDLAAVPEPASLATWGLIGLGLLAVRRYRRKK